MPKGYGQKIRMLYVMKVLWEKTDCEHAMNTADILAYLKLYGISADRKTLYDDIEQLRDFGWDIDTRPGRDGGHALVSRSFELSELVLLADAVQSSRFITEKKSEALISKLSGLTSIYESKRIGRQVHVSGRIKNMEETIFYNVDAIHNAISNDCQISFTYYDWNENKKRVERHGGALYTVSPHALCWDDENYYLVAYDEAAETLKHYRVDKMARIRQTDKKRTGKEKAADFDIGAYSGKLFGMFNGEETYVTLRCKNNRAGVIIDRFGTAVPFRKVDGECFELTVRVMLSSHFYTWLMNFGEDIVITSPDFAIEGLKAVARRALAAYEGEDDDKL